MVLDSDNDDAVPEGVPSTADLAADEEERDLSEPYDKIIRHLDIHCGTNVRHIATPHVPIHIRDSAPGAFPSILLSNIVVTAACNDHSIRLITLPLLPPPHSVNDSNTYGAVQTLTISGINTHHEVPSSISITHSAISDTSESWEGSSNSRSRSRNRVNENEKEGGASHKSSRLWCFLLVSASATAGGLLLTHQVPIVADTQLSTAASDLRPIQRSYLGYPCLRTKVIFNPSAFPADRHSTLLISAADAGCVKLYQVSPDSRSDLSRGRRISTATTDTSTSGLHTSRGNPTPNGRFLVTLFPGFIGSSSSSSLQRPKRILDVAWVASGRAIAALLENGEWGVWDLEGAGPGSGPPSLFRGQINISGIQGACLNKFLFGGRITPATEMFPKLQKAQLEDSRDSHLAPMTPRTRKARSDGLFQGRGPSLGSDRNNAQPIRGNIGIMENAPSTASALSGMEESLLLAHGSSVIYISSLQALWRAQTRDNGTLDSAETTRPSPLPGLVSAHDMLISVDQMPHSLPAKKKPPLGTVSKEAPDILVVVDHRLVFFVSPLTEPTPTHTSESHLTFHLGKVQPSALEKLTDQALLGHGQLDLEGMDRVLDDMCHDNGAMNGQIGAFGKSVAFKLDDDGDMSMTSPTPKAGRKPKHGSLGSTGRNKRGAFS